MGLRSFPNRDLSTRMRTSPVEEITTEGYAHEAEGESIGMRANVSLKGLDTLELHNFSADLGENMSIAPPITHPSPNTTTIDDSKVLIIDHSNINS
jgi:hypothetical protein